jgi:Glycosyl hydrolase family 79 C-terminal beta domain
VASSSRRRLTGLTLVAILAAAVVVGLIASRGTSAHEAHATGSSTVALTVSGTPTGRAIPSGFLGLSLEYPAVEAYAGKDPNAINPVFEQLIRNLSPGQAPELRIGGDTTDWTWWPVPGVAKPGGIRYTLNDNFASVTGALAHALGARLILGVNFELDSKTDAATEAQALVAGIGSDSIEALELGNEPELYGSFTWYTTKSGKHVKGRAAGYDFSTFLPDYAKIARALPGVPLAGPATGAPKWIPELGKFLTTEPRVKVATLHRYPLQQCYLPTDSPKYPSVAHILAPSASEGLANTVAPLVGVAHSRHVALRIDEMNSVSCGGGPGVSNAFASALWVLDAVFQMARVGVDGVNIHTYPKAPYELFDFTHQDGTWSGSVAPEYYGLDMFAQAAPAGARLLRTSGSLGNVRAWATRATDGTIHVVLINDYTAQSRTVDVRIAGASGPATLERLRAPSVKARSGVTIGGQGFGTKTTTGLLSGRSTATPVTPANGTYVVHLPQASAAMLTIPATSG